MVTTIRAAFLGQYADLARSVGLDPLRMLDAVRIPREALDDPDLRVPTVAARALLENSARATEDFGLRLVERLTTSEMGPVNLVAREQPTMRETIAATIRYSALQDEAVLVKLEESGDLAILSLADRDLSFAMVRQSVELGVSQLLRVLQRHLGPHWRPHCVCFVYQPPKSLETHRRILGPDLEFDRDFNGIVFDRADLERRNPTADPEMVRVVEQFAQSLMDPFEANLPGDVRGAILALVGTGHCTIEATAERLGLEVRTLQRHLAGAGIGFFDLLQQVRIELADHYLEESERPLAEVAELLGFSALSAFSRWHQVHYRNSPSAHRADAGANRRTSR